MQAESSAESNDDRAIIRAGFRYALSLTHDRHDAEDLVQQACLKTFRSRGKLISKRYLFVAIRNLFVDRCRKKQLHRADLDTVDLADPKPSQSERLEHRDDIQTMLSLLSYEQREVLFLNCVEGYTAAEIAEITGQPRGTILSQLARAKKKLVDRFGDVEVTCHDD